ncbi:MAG: MCP four helix bundle domain-containing protein [Deltaproteobacteria bacterium]|nr:MCP four helix bundle domain-containing protein [Deltaproteobacteria bacterium]
MKGWRSLSLRARVYLIVGALVFVTVVGGSVMVWYTYYVSAAFEEVVETDVEALERSEELVIELARQKGFVSYYFITGDTAWLLQLEERRSEFKERLHEARSLCRTEGGKKILERLESEYESYVNSKDKVISLYKSGRRKEGAELHKEVRANFFEILHICNEFRDFHKQRIKESLDRSRQEARRYRIMAFSAMTGAVVLGGMLLFVLVTQILEPIRRLAAGSGQESHRTRDEVAELGSRVRGLVDDADQTRSELIKSREMLFQSEKMAVLGKLSADVAHSIRNPMTSIKMRLFSLERNLELSPVQKEDLEVVSEEMRRLDNIVRNFLEFSRPPKLKKQRLDISEVMDMALQLLQHRLEEGDVKVTRRANRDLPRVEADPELLKEVFVNLVVNACDAMEEGGQLIISEEEAVAEELGNVVMIKIMDSGPGIPASVLESVFEPFFSTKEDGTGLGLSIVERIIQEHGGHISVRSEEGGGATFIITLPTAED